MLDLNKFYRLERWLYKKKLFFLSKIVEELIFLFFNSRNPARIIGSTLSLEYNIHENIQSKEGVMPFLKLPIKQKIYE